MKVDWFARRLPPGDDLRTAGIYLWRVGDALYVGKAANLASRLNEYLRNIEKIEHGRPYRKGNPDGFRRVHHVLASAKASAQKVEWEVLETCDASIRLERERHWIQQLRPALNGPRRGPVENSND